MILCRVIGNTVATVKHPVYEGRKIMVVQTVDVDGHTPMGPEFLAVDAVQAGPAASQACCGDVHDVSGVQCDALFLQELSIVIGRDEADLLAVGLSRRANPSFTSQSSHLALLQSP